LIPEPIVRAVNAVSRAFTPGLAQAPDHDLGKFWVSLSFSMMMTIAMLCYLAQLKVRTNKHYTVPLLVSKCASALSGLAYFLFSLKALAYLTIFLVDGTLFLATLVFYLRANKAWFVAQTAFLRKQPVPPKITPATKVVVLKGEDKFQLLDQVLEQAGFWMVLDREFQKAGKTHESYRVVIKPNFMYTHSNEDVSTFTDPALVEALVDLLVTRGFTNVTLVEAQSTYGNYYENREVVKVAQHIGYSLNKNYRLVDLTEEMVPFDYGPPLGKHVVGPTWRDADFRVSFAKNKTHVFCNYTLTLKNIYGTLPMANKLKEYHSKREYDWPTIETLKHFPVHFGIIDAIISADGQFGVISDPTPNHTKTMIAGENLIAVDWVGATKMGLDVDNPRIGRFLPLAIEAFGKPEKIEWIGDQSKYEPWTNVSSFFIDTLDVAEEAYYFSNWVFAGVTAMDPYFKFKLKAWPIRLFRWVMGPVKRIYYPHDKM